VTSLRKLEGAGSFRVGKRFPNRMSVMIYKHGMASMNSFNSLKINGAVRIYSCLFFETAGSWKGAGWWS
jgi:hypothetical protein